MKTNTLPMGRYGQKDGTTPPANPPAPPANTPPPAPPAGDTVLTVDQFKAIVAAEIKANQPAPAPAPTGLTKEAAMALVAEMIKTAQAEAKADSTKPADQDAKAIAEEVAKQLEARRGNKMQQHAPDTNAGQARIETPTSWCKGNLPLHGRQLLNILMKRNEFDGIQQADLQRGEELGLAILGRYSQKGYVADGKALTSTGTNAGDELVPTSLAREIMRRTYLASDLLAALLPGEIDMPTNPYEYPLITTRPTFYYESAENTAATASAPGTAKITLTAKDLMALVELSYQVNEDAIIPVLPLIEGLLAEAAADAWESVILNGDTTVTHMDSDTHAISKAAEKSAMGLRKLALAVAANGCSADLSTGGISAANIGALRAKMGKWGVNPRDLLIVTGVKGNNKFLTSVSEVLTADKAGPNATILTGKLASIFGIPIIASANLRENLNASGVYDGSTTDKGCLILFNKNEFLLGRRADLLIETDRVITSKTHQVVASFRRAFQPKETPSATITSVAIGYNFAS